MNFSHGSYDVRFPDLACLSEPDMLTFSCGKYHRTVIDNARKAEKEQRGRPLAIALDTVRFP